jgi:hypothetical protein
MRMWFRWLIGVGVVALFVVAAVFPPRIAALFYHVTNSQRHFNIAVSRAVPKGATLDQLEGLVGRAVRTPVPYWMKKQILRDPSGYPEGWREGDDAVFYTFPDQSRWYFQVRGGRLVNYDPAVLAGQPQEHHDPRDDSQDLD